jgi:hypothetical protein
LRGQYWTCENAELSLADVWDNRDWTGMRHIISEMCGSDRHIYR